MRNREGRRGKGEGGRGEGEGNYLSASSAAIP